MTFEELVQQERIEQDNKWGIQDHKPSVWLAILMEEIGEMSSAIIKQDWKPLMQRDTNMEHELIQGTAVLKAMWECGKRNGWL